MKRSLLLIAAALVVLCFAQCTKQRPDSPHYSGKVGDKYLQQISVEASRNGNNSNSKVTMTPVNEAMNLAWETTDVIYVYDGSKKVDELNFVEYTSEDHSKAKFESISDNGVLLSDDAKLSFVYYGSGITGSEDFDPENVTVDFSAQDGDLGKLAANLVIMVDNISFNKQGNYDITLEVPFAVVRFQFKDFTEGADISITGLTSTGFSINAGVLTNNGTTSITIPTPEEDKDYYVALMPTSSNIDFKFKDGIRTDAQLQRDKKLLKNCYYTKEGTEGHPYVVMPPRYVDVSVRTNNTFSVNNSGGKVNFSRGNLVYINGSQWQMFDRPFDQMGYEATDGIDFEGKTGTDRDGIGAWNGNYISFFYYAKNITDACAQRFNTSLFNNPEVVLFTNETGTTTNNTIPGYRTLSNSEWVWLLGPSVDQDKTGLPAANPGENCRTSSTINGVQNARYANVRVDDFCGMLVFPDEFTWPDGVTDKPTTFNKYSQTYNGINYTPLQFSVLESAGAIFLPAAGFLQDYSGKLGVVVKVGRGANYHTSTDNIEYDNKNENWKTARYMNFNLTRVRTNYSTTYRQSGFSIRLVKDAAKGF